MDDFGATTSTAGAVDVGDSADGEIEEAADRDWFEVSLESGRTYRIRVLGAQNDNGTLDDPVLGGLFDDTGTLIEGTSDDDSGDGLDSLLEITPDSTGQYFIEAAAFESASGTYKVSVEDITPATGSTFDVFATDVVKSEGDAGNTVFEFTVKRTGDTASAASVDWSVGAATGDSADADDFSDSAFPGATLSFIAGEVSKVVSVEVSGDVEVEPDESFMFSLSNPSVDSLIGTGSKLGTILDDDESSSGTAFLAITSAPSEYEGNAGTTAYEFTVTRTGDASIAASASWEVQTAGGDGSANAADFDGGVLPSGMVSFAATETVKTVTVLVAGDTDSESNEAFSLVLSNPSAQAVISNGSKLGTITDDDVDDFGDTPGSAGVLGFGEGKLAVINEESDADWFCIELAAGTAYVIDLEGVDTGQGTLANPMIEGIFDADSIKLPDSSDDDGGTGLNSRLSFMSLVSGAYYIAATSADNGTGSYLLTISEIPNQEPTGTLAIDGQAKVGVTLTVIDSLEDGNGLGVRSYQWQADGVDIAGATGTSFTPGEDEVGTEITVVASYTDGAGYEESVESSPTDPVSAAGSLIEGTPGPDSLVGTEGNDTLIGADGRDTLEGLDGDDQIDGGADIDFALYSGSLVEFTIFNNAGVIEVSGPGHGMDTLSNVERLVFDDTSLAFDLDGSPGDTAKLLGILLGPDQEQWYNPALVGIGIDAIDNLGFTFESLMALAIDIVLPGATDGEVVDHLFFSLVGAPTPQDLKDDLVGLLGDGIFTRASLAVAAAELDLHLENIGFVGLVDLGIQYMPVA